MSVIGAHWWPVTGGSWFASPGLSDLSAPVTCSLPPAVARGLNVRPRPAGRVRITRCWPSRGLQNRQGFAELRNRPQRTETQTVFRPSGTALSLATAPAAGYQIGGRVRVHCAQEPSSHNAHSLVID